MAIEEVALVLIASLLAFDSNQNTMGLSDPTTIERNQPLAVIIVASILGLYSAILLSVFYLYREFRSNNDAD